MTSATIARSNTRIGLIALALAVGMLGMGFAAVPLYQMFCQVTGFNGTTQRVTEADAQNVTLTTMPISVRFDANVERGMPWDFKPLQSTDTVSIGARDMAVYTARNTSDRAVTGSATFNVEPAYVGKYFNKVQCFCFTEQRLEPGQEVRMPVLYFIDPAILDDPAAKDVEQITLSYTFHPAVEDAKALDRTASGS